MTYNTDLNILYILIWLLVGSFVSGILTPSTKGPREDWTNWSECGRHIRIALFWPFVLMSRIGNHSFNKEIK